ncbi:MAG: site-specific DNA-methyltransferase [Pseudomonadota bacterium]|nr:site-specific DNA-methyltransferase [Pseudomonadota bacterium]
MQENLSTGQGSGYRVVDLDWVLNRKTQALLKRFNSKFNPNEIVVVARDNKVSVLLKAVDMYKLRSAVEEITATHSASNLFTQVLSAVESIGSYGVRAGKRHFIGYADERKVSNRSDKELRRGKYFYAKDHSFDEVVNTPPQNLVDKIVSGDAEYELRKLPDNCVDLIFTSPPYNFGLDYGGNGDDVRWEGYFDKLFAVFDECIRVLKFGGRIAVNVQPLFSDYIPSHHVISSFFIKRRLIWKGELLWEKNNYNCKYTAWGSWKSPASPYLKYTWEFIEVFTKGSLKTKGDKANADITADEFKSWVNARWSIAPERNMKAYDHPAMFPEELAKRVLKLFSFSGSYVLDPFVGTGTTAVVAKKLQRKYLGIDISDSYCDVANKRLGLL